MSLYLVTLTVLDDPAVYEVSVLVDAPTVITAEDFARPAAIECYRRAAGGYALRPMIDDDERPVEVVPFTIKPGVLLVSGSYQS